MFGVSKAISRRLLVPVTSSQKCSVRHKTVPIITISPPIYPSKRTMGPYPRTPEELELAAKKYNLIPEDYKPFPEEEGWGDYPDLPAVGAFNRDKYDDFEDIWEMRHYGEPFHLHADMYSWERKDPMWDEKITYVQSPYWWKYTVIFGFMGSVAALIMLPPYFGLHINHPWKQRDYNGGRPQYAFPESESAHSHHH